MPKLTKRQLGYFRTRVAFWANHIGIFDWVITVTGDSQENGLVAWVTSDLEAREADMRLNLMWPEGAPKPTDHELDLTAAHECLHVLLAPITCLSAKAGRRERDTSEHQVLQLVLKLMTSNPIVE